MHVAKGTLLPALQEEKKLSGAGASRKTVIIVTPKAVSSIVREDAEESAKEALFVEL